MVFSGVPTRVAAVLARENVGVDLVYDLPKAGFTEPVSLEQGMVQGRIDAPARFRIFLDHVLAPVVKLWAEAGFGVRWGFRGEKTLSHVVWADNVLIFATSAAMYQSMINILTIKLERVKM